MHLHYKTLIAGRGQKTCIKINDILNTFYTNMLATFDHYWKTISGKKFIHSTLLHTLVHSFEISRLDYSNCSAIYDGLPACSQLRCLARVQT